MRRGITPDEYDKKARELKRRETEIVLRIAAHRQGEGDFRATLEGLISLPSRVANYSSVRKRTKSGSFLGVKRHPDYPTNKCLRQNSPDLSCRGGYLIIRTFGVGPHRALKCAAS
jgi:hypothetical protein